MSPNIFLVPTTRSCSTCKSNFTLSEVQLETLECAKEDNCNLPLLCPRCHEDFAKYDETGKYSDYLKRFLVINKNGKPFKINGIVLTEYDIPWPNNQNRRRCPICEQPTLFYRKFPIERWECGHMEGPDLCGYSELMGGD